MGMQDRDWYKEHHKQRHSAPSGAASRPSFSNRPQVIIRSRFLPGFIVGAVVGAVVAMVLTDLSWIQLLQEFGNQ